VKRSFPMPAETPRRSRPPPSGGLSRQCASTAQDSALLDPSGFGFCGTIFSNVRLNSSAVASATISQAVSRMRFARSSLVRLGEALRGIAYFPMSRSIGQSLTYNAPNDAIGSLNVVDAECGPLVVAEVELGKIPLQVLLADVMIDAINATLQDREVAFNGNIILDVPIVTGYGFPVGS
jgi:hypothetical protein